MNDVKMPHTGHEEHLCYLHNLGFLNDKPDEYKELVKNGQWMCKSCGRVAANDKNLCVPEKL